MTDQMSDEDEELRRVIALSLQETEMQEQNRSRQSRNRNRDVVDEDEDEDEEEDEEAQFERDLKAAIEASKLQAQAQTQTQTQDGASVLPRSVARLEEKTKKKKNGGGGDEKTEEDEGPKSGFLSERAKMERERLERARRRRRKGEESQIQKRMREVGVLAEADERGGEKGINGIMVIVPPSKKQRMDPKSPVRTVTQVQAGSKASSTSGSGSKTNNAAARNGKGTVVIINNGTGGVGELFFWDGELRQIANRLVPRDLDDDRPTFRLSEIVEPKSEITLAILSSYSNSVEWLYDFFDPDPGRTAIVLVNQPGEDGNPGVKELAPNMIMTKPFIRNGRGCMHIKIMLLFYKDGRLRIVVPTANFVDYDWRDIENTAWVQDIPLREGTIRHDPKADDFPGTLQRVLHSLNVPAALTKFLDGDFPDLPIEALSELRMRWDWSRVKAKLVASLAGKHEGWEKVERTGHPALMRAVRELGAQTPKDKQLVLECQGSSIGAYSRQWMDEFYCSARGESARTWLDKSRIQRSKLPWPPIRILFPSLQTVKDSVLGMPGGGTMFCRKTQWESKNFPRELFHDSNSKRGGVLMHSKMIVGLFREGVVGIGGRSEDGSGAANENKAGKGEGDEGLIGWTYVGSHNFTPSAWGTLSGSVESPSLNIVNYELGIVLPLRTYEDVERVACWRRPARKYVEGVDRPWMQDEMGVRSD